MRAFALLALLSPTLAHAQSVVLYTNDFEAPNVPIDKLGWRS